MKSIDKQDGFEQAWRKALTDGETEPPSSVWQKVESGLATGEASMYRRRLLFFKWVAAASIVLSAGLGIYIWSNMDDDMNPAGMAGRPSSVADAGQLAEASERDRSEAGAMESNMRDREAQAVPRDGASGIADRRAGQVLAPGRADRSSSDDAGRGLAAADIDREPMLDAQRTAHRPVRPGVNRRWTAVAAWDVPWPSTRVYRTPTIIPDESSEAEALQLIAGVRFSTGRFDPGYTSSGTAPTQPPVLAAFETEAFRNVSDNMAQSASQLAGERYAPAVSFSYGFNVGARVAGRWIVQTGLNYVRANSTARTSAYYQDAKTLEKTAVLRPVQYEKEGIVQLVQSDPLELRNDFEFASVPLKAGYLLYDKKVNIALLAGVSADFLIANTVTDTGGLLRDYSMGTGDASPYKSILYNGSISTTLGTVIADRYHLTVEPGYRMALTDFSKESFSLNSRPNALYLSFGMQYRFK